jgi:hypothetical protein
LKHIVLCGLIGAIGIAGPAVGRCAESVFTMGGGAAVPSLSLAGREGHGGFGSAAAVATEGAVGERESGQSVGTLNAALSSLLLPGLGEYRLGHTLRARIFFGLESVSWLSIGSFLWVGHSREEAYENYAVVYGDVRGTGHSDEFYRIIGLYPSNEGTSGFNESVRRDARDQYYPDVEAMEAYYRGHRMVGDDGWRWRTEDARSRYVVLRDGSRYAYRVALYCAITAAALRIVSAADAVRISRLEQQRSESGAGNTLSLDLERKGRGIAIGLKRSF